MKEHKRAEVHPHKYSQLIFDKKDKGDSVRKESLTNDAGTLTSKCKKPS